MDTTNGLAAILRDARKGALLRTRSEIYSHPHSRAAGTTSTQRKIPTVSRMRIGSISLTWRTPLSLTVCGMLDQHQAGAKALRTGKPTKNRAVPNNNERMTLKFRCPAELEGKLPPPIPATLGLPTWLK